MSFDRSQIPGWGADLDRSKRPGVPMERMPPREDDAHWDIPEAQPRTVEVLHSNERPGLTPVFGTAVPPSGLSGKIRRAAIRHSEGRMRQVQFVAGLDERLIQSAAGFDAHGDQVERIRKAVLNQFDPFGRQTADIEAGEHVAQGSGKQGKQPPACHA